MTPTRPRFLHEVTTWGVTYRGEKRTGMGIFATLTRKGAHAEATADADPAAEVQGTLPTRFVAVGERLAAGHDASTACALVGRETARDGADLGEALDGLRATYAQILGGEPDFGAVRALCQAWSEETLGYLHQLSCEDPLTGLASLAHLRAKLAEVYRAADLGGQSAATSHALVVVDLPRLAGPPRWDAFESALVLVRLAECCPAGVSRRTDHRPDQLVTPGRGRSARRPARSASGPAARSRRGSRPGGREGPGLDRGPAAR